MHAYGMPATSTKIGYVRIDHIDPDIVIDRSPTNYVMRLSIGEAETLQRQLGVAIREAVGQTRIEYADKDITFGGAGSDEEPWQAGGLA